MSIDNKKNKLLCVTILAAGNGTRMNSSQPKVLLKIKEEPMLIKIIQVIKKLNPNKIIIIVNNNNIDLIKKAIQEYFLNSLSTILEFIIQDVALGTGHAINKSIFYLNTCKQNGMQYNLILNGDTPCLQPDTLKTIYEFFLNNIKENTNNLLITGIHLTDAAANGRILQTDDSIKIVEYKDCNEQERLIKLVNVGIYIADIDLINICVPKITNNNKQKEYYLTDIVKLSSVNNFNVILHILEDSKSIEIFNINTKDELNYINQHLN